MKNKLFNFSIIVNFILYSTVLISAFYLPKDPDLGWHLKYGEYFFKTGEVLRTNPFTQLMTDYKWNNSSWLTDLISYQAFNHFGFMGLAILSSIVVMLTFLFLAKASRLSIFEKSIIFPVLIYFTSSINYISFRGQLLSLLFLAIMYFILSKYKDNNKNVLFLILLFLFWGNFHGQYILGFGIFIIWTFVYFIKEHFLDYRKNMHDLFLDNKYLIITFLAIPFVLLINPFGFGVYIEAIKHFDDPLQKSIAEFLAPADFSATWWHLIFMGIILTMGTVLSGTSRKNLDKIPFFVPSYILLLFTLWIKRYAWTFYYSSIFLMQPVVHFLEPENKKHSNYASFIISIIFLSTVLYIKQPYSQFTNMNWGEYCKKSISCSPTAANAVIINKLNNEKLLTIYDYGGSLIWNYPMITPTIDGRMHLWRNSQGYSAFEYYYPFEQNLKHIENTKYDTVLTSKNKPIYFRLLELTKQGKWQVVHVDKYSAVFVKNK